MNFLKENDIAVKIFANGLWAISFYKGLGLTPGGATSKSYVLVLGNKGDLDEVRKIIPLSWSKNVSNSFVASPDQIEDIPNMWFDLETDIDDEKRNPLRGIRVSNIPDDKIKPITGVIGDSLREIYIRGNFKTPIPDQFIADYRREFFQAGNLIFFSFDFIIPVEIRSLSKFILSNSDDVNVPIIKSFTRGVVKQDELDKIKDKFLVVNGDDVYTFDDTGKLLSIINRKTGKKTNDNELGKRVLDGLNQQTINFPVTKYSDLKKLKEKFLIRESLFVRDKDGDVVFKEEDGKRNPVTEIVYNAKQAQKMFLTCPLMR
jgi:hypothetical protein